jgi:hypothetical protein
MAVVGMVRPETPMIVEIVPFAGMAVVGKRESRLWEPTVTPVRVVATPASSFTETPKNQLRPCAFTEL